MPKSENTTCLCIWWLCAVILICIYIYIFRQDIATQRNTLRHNATHCNTLQHTVTHCHTMPNAATRWNSLQHAATRCNILQHEADVHIQNVKIIMSRVVLCNNDHNVSVHGAVWCSVVQCVVRCSAVCCSMLQYAAVCCSVLQCIVALLP